jgi:hypothetical protein
MTRTSPKVCIGGLVRAICSDRGRLCETPDIKRNDIRIREPDRRRPFMDIAAAPGLVASAAPARKAVPDQPRAGRAGMAAVSYEQVEADK